MRIPLRVPGLSGALILCRVRWAYGITSQVPGTEDHYLFFDIDHPHFNDFWDWFHPLFSKNEFSGTKTPHGWHFKVWDVQGTLKEIAGIMLEAPQVDITWLSMGLKRGYWFLEQRKRPFATNKPLTYMRVQLAA